jgi:segregation and condensation protein B
MAFKKKEKQREEKGVEAAPAKAVEMPEKKTKTMESTGQKTKKAPEASKKPAPRNPPVTLVPEPDSAVGLAKLVKEAASKPSKMTDEPDAPSQSEEVVAAADAPSEISEPPPVERHEPETTSESSNRESNSIILAPRSVESVQAPLHEPDNPSAILEAALFMSGQPIGAADLAKLVGIAALGHVNELLGELSTRYDNDKSALEVVQEENGKWTMRVRAAWAPSVRNFAGEAEISRHALRTLAYISKNEGIKKRDLFMRLGSTIYDDVAELLEKGFVSATPAGRTVSLKTTGKFKQYFNG